MCTEEKPQMDISLNTFSIIVFILFCLPFSDLQSADVDSTLHILQKLEDLLSTGKLNDDHLLLH